jgi:hypothetical protein
VNEIEVTAPRTSDLAITCIDYILSLAIVPSPAPTIISPLGRIFTVTTPNEKSFPTGPSLL